MLKFQILFIVVLISCLAFVSCNRTQKVLQPAGDAMDTMMDDHMMDMMAHKSWAHTMLPAPGPQEDAGSPAETGGVHGMGSRTVYINDVGVMANKEGMMYPAGSMIVKEIMDDANEFVAKVAMMTKTDDEMYADHNGWMYVKYARMSADGEYEMVGGGSMEKSMGCHGCHAKADNDSVFVSLSMDDHMKDDDMMDDHMKDDDMMDDHMMDMMAHKSWAHTMLPAPGPQEDAGSPAETGGVHGMGSRTVYINDVGVMANKEGMMYPAGSMIVKEIMDDANEFVAKVAMMTKTDDEMYADHNGWMYVKYARMSADGEYEMVGGGSMEKSMGCHGCHAKADNDSVFVSLSMDDHMKDDDMMDDHMKDDDMMDDHMKDDDMMDDHMEDDDMMDDAGGA